MHGIQQTGCEANKNELLQKIGPATQTLCVLNPFQKYLSFIFLAHFICFVFYFEK